MSAVKTDKKTDRKANPTLLGRITSRLRIYKPKQAGRTRVATTAGAVFLAVVGGVWLSEELAATSVLVQFLVPSIVVVAASFVIFLVVNRPSTADFLIETEGEMKKVAWSSKREIIGSTKVVVFTTFVLAAMLYVVDLIFLNFFKWIGVLRLG